MPISKAAFSAKIAGLKTPCLPVTWRERSPVRWEPRPATPRPPPRSDTTSLLALRIKPGSTPSSLDNPGRGPGTSWGKQNHNTKSCRPLPTAAQHSLQVGNTQKCHFSSLSCLMVTTSLRWDAPSLYALWKIVPHCRIRKSITKCFYCIYCSPV